LPMKTADSG